MRSMPYAALLAALLRRLGGLAVFRQGLLQIPLVLLQLLCLVVVELVLDLPLQLVVELVGLLLDWLLQLELDLQLVQGLLLPPLVLVYNTKSPT